MNKLIINFIGLFAASAAAFSCVSSVREPMVLGERNGSPSREVRRITANVDAAYDSSITNDLSKMVYTSSVFSNRDIWLNTVDGVTQITSHSADDFDPSLSPDGQKVAFVSRRADASGDVHVIDSEKSTYRKLVGGENSSIRIKLERREDRGPTWFPDGKRVVFSSQLPNKPPELRVYDLETELVSSIEGAVGFTPDVSNDGKYITYAYNGSIFTYEMDTGREEAVSVFQTALDSQPRFVGGNERIVFSRISLDSNRNGKLDIDDNSSIWFAYRSDGRWKSTPLTSFDFSSYSADVKGENLFFTKRASDGVNVHAVKWTPDVLDIGRTVLPHSPLSRKSWREALFGLSEDEYKQLSSGAPDDALSTAINTVFLAHRRGYLSYGRLLRDRLGKEYSYKGLKEELDRALKIEALLGTKQLFDVSSDLKILEKQVIQSWVKKCDHIKAENILENKVARSLRVNVLVTCARSHLSLKNYFVAQDYFDSALNVGTASTYQDALIERARVKMLALTSSQGEAIRNYIEFSERFEELSLLKDEAMNSAYRLLNMGQNPRLGYSDIISGSKLQESTRATLQSQFGYFNLDQGRPILAVNELILAIKLFPDQVSNVLDSAQVLLSLDLGLVELTRMIDYLYVAEEKNNNVSLSSTINSSLVKKSQLLIQQGKYKDAEEVLLTVLARDENNILANKNLMNLYQKSDQVNRIYREVIANIDESSTDPIEKYLLALAESYSIQTDQSASEKLGRIDEILEKFRDVTKLLPHNAYAAQLMGWLLYQKYFWTAEYKVQGSLMGTVRNTVESLAEFVGFELDSGLQEAIFQSRKAYFMHGKDTVEKYRVASNLAEIYRGLGNYKKALYYYTKRISVLERFPEQDFELLGYLYLNAGKAAFHSDETELAIVYILKSVKIWESLDDLDNVAFSKDYLAMLYREGSEHQSSKELYTELRQGEKSDHSFNQLQFTLSQAHVALALGEFDDVVELVEDARKILKTKEIEEYFEQKETQGNSFKISLGGKSESEGLSYQTIEKMLYTLEFEAYYKAKRYKDASKVYGEVSNIPGIDFRKKFEVLVTLAQLEEDVGDFDSATSLLSKSLGTLGQVEQLDEKDNLLIESERVLHKLTLYHDFGFSGSIETSKLLQNYVSNLETKFEKKPEIDPLFGHKLLLASFSGQKFEISDQTSLNREQKNDLFLQGMIGSPEWKDETSKGIYRGLRRESLKNEPWHMYLASGHWSEAFAALCDINNAKVYENRNLNYLLMQKAVDSLLQDASSDRDRIEVLRSLNDCLYRIEVSSWLARSTGKSPDETTIPQFIPDDWLTNLMESDTSVVLAYRGFDSKVVHLAVFGAEDGTIYENHSIEGVQNGTKLKVGEKNRVYLVPVGNTSNLSIESWIDSEGAAVGVLPHYSLSNRYFDAVAIPGVLETVEASSSKENGIVVARKSGELKSVAPIGQTVRLGGDLSFGANDPWISSLKFKDQKPLLLFDSLAKIGLSSRSNVLFEAQLPPLEERKLIYDRTWIQLHIALQQLGTCGFELTFEQKSGGIFRRNVGCLAKKTEGDEQIEELAEERLEAAEEFLDEKSYLLAARMYSDVIGLYDLVGDEDEALENLKMLVKILFKAGDLKAGYSLQKEVIRRMKSSEGDEEEIIEETGTLGVLASRAEMTKVSMKIFDDLHKYYTEEDDEDGLAKVYHYRALNYEIEKKYDEAIKEYQKSIEILDGEELSKIFQNIGNIYMARLSDFKNALTYYQKSLDETESDSRSLSLKIDIANTYNKIGKNRSAVRVLSSASAMKRSSILDYRWNQTMGSSFFLLGNLYQAKQKTERMKKLVEKIGDLRLKYRFKVEALNVMGLILIKEKKFDQAFSQFEEALELARKHKLTGSIALTLNNLGYCQRETGEIDGSIESFKEALRIDTGLKSQKDIAYDLRNLGLSKIAKGNLSAALSDLEKSLKTSEKLDLKYNLVLSLVGKAQILWKRKSFDEAQKTLEKGYELAKSEQMLILRWHTANFLAKVLDQQGKKKAARAYLEESIELLKILPPGLLLEESPSGLWVENSVSQFFDFVVGYYFDNSQHRDALRMVDLSSKRRFFDSLVSYELRHAAKEVFEEFTEVKTRILQSPADSQLEEKLHLVTKAIEEKFRQKGSQLLISEKRLRLKPSHLIHVNYVASDRLLNWTINNGEIKGFVSSIAKQDLMSLVDRYKKLLYGYSNPELYEDQLAKVILQGSQDILSKSDATDLKIYADKFLSGVPYSSLPMGERRLVDQYSISYLSTLTEGLETKSTFGGGTQLLAVANPTTELADLPFASKEIRRIKRNFPNTKMLMGDKATVLSIKQRSAEADILHLAVHGGHDAKNIGKSYLQLAGAGEKSRLEVHEVLGWELDSDLVVLSACNESREFSSHGVENDALARSFLFAGAHRVVSSLWRVDDVASGVLMKRFYRYLAKGMSPSKALQKSQQVVRQVFNHPIYWAPFKIMEGGT